MADHRGDYNLLGHEQVHPDYLVADNILEVLDHDLLLETILPPAVTRLTNVLQPYRNPVAKGLIEPVHVFPSDSVEEMRAGVHRMNDGRMPCQALCLRLSGRREQRRSRVSLQRMLGPHHEVTRGHPREFEHGPK